VILSNRPGASAWRDLSEMINTNYTSASMSSMLSRLANLYANIRHDLVTTGEPIDAIDMMIAAYSMARSAVLVSNNTQHYRNISGPLVLENWF
jgi:predicted nucleic acid-binding protein